MRVKMCIGLNGEQCTYLTTSETQLCEYHEKEMREKVRRAKEASDKNT